MKNKTIVSLVATVAVVAVVAVVMFVRTIPTNMTNLDLLAIATTIGTIITAAGVFIGPQLTEKYRRRREHFERLKSEIFGPWLSELEKYYDCEFNIKVDRISEVAFGPIIIYTFDLDLEKKYLFKDIEKHFPDIMKDWRTFKEGLSEYGERCLSFFREIGVRAEKKAELPLRDKVFIKDRCISRGFVERIYNKLISEVSGKHPSYQEIEPTIKGLNKEGVYEIGWTNTAGDYYFFASGSKDEMKRCKSIFKELGEDLEYKKKAKELIELTKNLKGHIKKIRNRLEEIIEMKKLPGGCQYT